MKKLERALYVLAALLLMAAVCPVSGASAAEPQAFTATVSPDLTAKAAREPGLRLTTNGTSDAFDFSTIHDYLQEQFESYVPTVSLLSYGIPAGQIMDLFDYIINHLPESFHVNNTFTYRTAGGCISSLNVSYRYTQAEYAPLLAQLRQNADWLLRDLAGSNLTDAEKALLIHDRIVVWTTYGTCGDNSDTSPCFRASGPLLMHEGVCSGYAKLYEYLLSRIGIESQYVVSEELNHAWNIVKINGEWYHVDTTWDDDGYNDVVGRVSHENFLRSTAGIVDTGHAANDYTAAPVSTTYDSAYWQDSFTEFVACGGALYYIDAMTPGLYQRSGNTSRKLLSLNGSWGGWQIRKSAASQSNVYISNFYCLSADNNELYYSSPTEVVRLSLPELTAVTVYAPTLASGSYIYGMKAVDWVLTVQIGTNPVTITQTQTITVPHDYTVTYDANGGSGAPGAQTKPNGQTLTLSWQTPSRDQYVFAGWNTKADGTGTDYQPGDPYAADADVTLYAQWNREPPVIKPAAGGVLINKASHMIYGLRIGSAADDCLAVNNGSLVIAYSNPNGIVGTGTKVTVCNSDQEPVETYTVVVFGDLNGDGWYDGSDAYLIDLIANGLIPLTALTDAERMACDANHDDAIDAADAKLVRQAGLLLSSVDQSANNEDLIKNSAYVEYCGLIDQSVGAGEPVQPQAAAGATNIVAVIRGLFRALFAFLSKLFAA